MTINIFVLKGDLNGENRSGAFLFLPSIVAHSIYRECSVNTLGIIQIQPYRMYANA